MFKRSELLIWPVFRLYFFWENIDLF